ncbi:hypothetical protein MNBD_GAMMA01-503 [hydrothermal vent metagenome]|uniref:Uncharacterized protein n=1 Tax=hydrothermal vent metagenome TaxID=652676 RepID=A0A3B0VMJ8_9ZZZZ
MKENSFAKQFAKGFRGISKLICHLPIEQKDFVTSLKFNLVHTAKELFPNKSNAELSKITGISRGTLADYLDQDAPEHIVNKDAILLNHLWMNKDKNNSIPLRGKVSFYSIAKVILNSSYSPSSALDSLIKLNAIKLSNLDQDNITVIIIQNHLDIAIEEEYGLFINQIGIIIDKLCDTTINNMHNNDKSYQQTSFSGSLA